MKRAHPLQGLLIALLAALAFSAHAWDRGTAIKFATLPPGTAHPEGITADAQGNIYVADFDVSGETAVGNVIVFNRAGRLVRKMDIAGSSPLLLGIAFHPQTGALLVIDFGNQRVLKIDPLGAAPPTVFTTIPGGASAGPNALAFDPDGNVYISDSFAGAIWRTGPAGSPVATLWLADPLLATSGVPPFGANGLAFNNAYSALFVANTGNDTVVKIPLPLGPSGAPGTPEVFVNSINGADGVLIDSADNLWVAANQSDEIVVLDGTGRVIAKLGDFGGIDAQGSPIGLLFPASLVISNGFLYVTNLSLDLRILPVPQTTNSQWSAQVTRHTIARMRAQIPPVRGFQGVGRRR
ncbi:MAG TPA: NHL repeat-containing protein [Casimicrobiaceae bacterium]